MDALPPKQKKILQYLTKKQKLKKFLHSPTYADLAIYFGVDESTIREQVTTLISKGFLTRIANKRGGLRVVGL